ncbi:MAG: hypothetical protein ABSH28_01565 [Acidobacteriota bacterium]|jgi:hypothetical protein
MIRKSIFWGITLMLGTVLVWLVIQGRREETKQAAAPTEIVQTAKASPTRIFAPGDLEVGESREGVTSKQATPAPIGKIEIRNHGKVAYHDIMLKLTCLGGGGKVLDAQTRLIPGTIEPAQVLALSDLTFEGIPRGTVRYDFSILYCDFGPAPRTE